MNNNFCVYSNKINLSLKKDIEIIKKYLMSQYPYYHLAIFSDTYCETSIDYPVVSAFYLKFFKGSVIFLSQKDYLYFKNKLYSKNIYVLSDSNLDDNINIIFRNKETL
jgi:hypothetical protein